MPARGYVLSLLIVKFYLHIFLTNDHNYNMHDIIIKLVFQAGVKGASERSELTPCKHIILLYHQGTSITHAPL